MTAQESKRRWLDGIRQFSLGVLSMVMLAIMPFTARADTVNVQATPTTYAPPFTIDTGHFTVPPANTLSDEYSLLVATYKSFYGSITASCGFPLVVFPAPLADGSVASVTYTSPCHGGPNYFKETVVPGQPGQCPPGYTPDQPPPNTVTCSRPDVSITAGKSTIPTGSGVDDNNHVFTQSDLTLQITKAGQPDPGQPVTLQSDRGQQDTIAGPGAADSSGNATATVSTRDQPGSSTITSATPDVNTLQPANINWLPAHYTSQFLVTAYVISLESDYTSTPLAAAPGIPGQQFHQGFLNDVRLQGSGQALNGSYVHYQGHGLYNLETCFVTASGACAVDGQTAAVDFAVIPSDGTFSVDSVGTLTAQDTGGGINGYHIDVFFGTRRQDALQLGREYHDVDFLSY